MPKPWASASPPAPSTHGPSSPPPGPIVCTTHALGPLLLPRGCGPQKPHCHRLLSLPAFPRPGPPSQMPWSPSWPLVGKGCLRAVASEWPWMGQWEDRGLCTQAAGRGGAQTGSENPPEAPSHSGLPGGQASGPRANWTIQCCFVDLDGLEIHKDRTGRTEPGHLERLQRAGSRAGRPVRTATLSPARSPAPPASRRPPGTLRTEPGLRAPAPRRRGVTASQAQASFYVRY